MSSQLNLYNPALRRRIDWISAGPVAAGSAILIVVMVAATVWAGMAARAARSEADGLAEEVKSVKIKLDDLEKRVARKPSQSLAEEVAALQSTIADRRGILATLGEGGEELDITRGFAEFFRGFARQSPAGLWLTGFTITAGGAEMELSGCATDPALLPKYIRQLNAEPAFKGRGFVSLSLKKSQEGGSKSCAGPRSVSFSLQPVRMAVAVKPEGAVRKSDLKTKEIRIEGVKIGEVQIPDEEELSSVVKGLPTGMPAMPTGAKMP
ncbi:MAG: PilN domain-containing protein [Rhodocyclaceae bacterium]|nr:PilN domain-containing protein [Rhodocyclaceae bacterium]